MISIIIPTYNYARYIERAISSALCQTYENIEIIIIDDGSTDNTKMVVDRFNDQRVRYYYQNNKGACAARNHGIRKAKGDYILFEDADDFIEPKHLEEYMKVAIKNPGCNVYGSAEKVRLVGGDFIVLSEKGKCPGNDLLEHWLGHWAIHPNCILWPRENIEKVGGWDETLHANQDGDIAIRALLEGIKFVYANNAPKGKYLRHEEELGQISSTFNEKTIYSKIKVFEKVEKKLSEKGALNRNYRIALAEKYYRFARLWIDSFPEISDTCFKKFRRLNGFRKPTGSYANWILIMLVGLRNKEKLAKMIGGYIPWRF